MKFGLDFNDVVNLGKDRNELGSFSTKFIQRWLLGFPLKVLDQNILMENTLDTWEILVALCYWEHDIFHSRSCVREIIMCSKFLYSMKPRGFESFVIIVKKRLWQMLLGLLTKKPCLCHEL